jgi:FAD/FMN-containing dehydrogenase
MDDATHRSVSGSQLSRRTFLTRAGSAVGALTLAPRLAQLTAAGSVTDRDWSTLERTLRGRLIRPGQPGFEAAAPGFNLRYADVLPGGIAECADARDVRTALRWARRHDLHLVPRAGGHSYAGYSSTEGLLIDVNGMTDATFDPGGGTVHVVGGARNADLAVALQPHDVTVSAGRCPTVAVAGLTLGGGFGFSARALGLTADALVETEIVTADGELRTCNERDHADLFWACRGGGGGNFGINTSFVFQTSPVTNVAIYRLSWDAVEPAAMLAAGLELLATGPDELSMRMGFTIPADPGDGVSLQMIGQLFGSPAELSDLLAPVVAIASPATTELDEVTYWQGKDLLADNEGPSAFTERSRFVPTPLSSEGLDAFDRLTRERPRTVGPSSATVKLFNWGGVINRVASDETAFVHRDSIALLSVGVGWATDERPHRVRALRGWADDLWEQMGPFTSDRSYQNFIDPALDDWPRAYYGENLDRLVRIKRRYDPDDIFRFAQSIPASLRGL